MSRLSKAGLVAGGYLLAFAIACVAVALWRAGVPADAQASQGMMAFGESVLFLFTFAVASIPPTCAILYFLRPYPLFWRASALVILGTATTTAVLTLVNALATRGPGAIVGSMWIVTPLRTFVAPPLFLAFLLAGVFAPARSPRLLLLVAAAAEAALFACVVFIWTHPPH